MSYREEGARLVEVGGVSMLDDVPSELKTHGVALVLVANVGTGHLRRIGDGVAGRWLVSSLFGTPSRIRATVAACVGQLTPKAWSQGRDHCFLIQPSEGTLFGMVVTDFDGDVHAQHRLGEVLAAASNQIDWEELAPL